MTPSKEPCDERDALIGDRLAAEAGRTEAVLRSLAENARGHAVRIAAAAKLRELIGEPARERPASRRPGGLKKVPQLPLEAIERMQDVMKEIKGGP